MGGFPRRNGEGLERFDGMTKLNRQPNMYDVAKLAQVSHQTVSRVVNNYPSMRPETRARVVQAMDLSLIHI